jgi:hypothetical protein
MFSISLTAKWRPCAESGSWVTGSPDTGMTGGGSAVKRGKSRNFLAVLMAAEDDSVQAVDISSHSRSTLT